MAGGEQAAVVVSLLLLRWLFMVTRKDLQCDTETEIATEKSVWWHVPTEN